MKTKYLTLILIIGIVLLTMNGCAFIGGTGSTTTDSGALCLDYKKTGHSQLEVGLVHEMTKIYQNEARKNHDSVIAIRFNLNSLKKFIYHIEMEAKKQNIPNQDLGVRIYYARYPKKAEWKSGAKFEKDLSGFLGNPLTEKYVGKHTLLMIPTIKKDSIHQDYNPFDTTTYRSGLSSSLYAPLNEGGDPNPQPIFLLAPATSTNDNLRKNHGELYPPYPEIGMDFIQQ